MMSVLGVYPRSLNSENIVIVDPGVAEERGHHHVSPYSKLILWCFAWIVRDNLLLLATSIL